MLTRESLVRLMKLSTTAPAHRRREHIAIIASVFAERIPSGPKTIECRLTRVRGPARECIHTGGTVHLREEGGGFRLKATVAGTLHIRGLTPRGLGAIRDLFGTHIAASEAYRRSRKGARYALLIWLTDGRATPEGPALWRWPGFRDRSAWGAWGAWVVMPSHSPFSIPAGPVTLEGPITCWKREA